MIEVVWLENDRNLMNKSDELFQRNGINIIKCTTPSQALKQLRERDCPNLLLDIEFPNSKRDGIVFLEQILELNIDVKTVILTGYPLLQEALELVNKSKVADYIEKPIPRDKVGQQIFFKKIKSAFNKELDSPKNDKKSLRTWRRKSWIQLVVSILLIVLCFTLIAWKKSWNYYATIEFIEKTKYLSISIAVIWAIFNTFIIKALYDKYYNYSNINNYLKNIKSSNK